MPGGAPPTRAAHQVVEITARRTHKYGSGGWACQRSPHFASRKRRGLGPLALGPEAYFFALLIVPVTPSREQLNGSILRLDGAYSLVARGNGCLKNSMSAMSTSRTRRWRVASSRSRSTLVSAAECSSPLVGCPGCSTYWFSTPAE